MRHVRRARWWRAPALAASAVVGLLLLHYAFLPEGTAASTRNGGVAATTLVGSAVAAPSLSPSALPRVLKLATANMWQDPGPVLDELWILSVIAERATGARLQPLTSSSPKTEADVIFLGLFGDVKEREELARLSREGAPFATVFIAFECVSDDMAGRADIALGHAKRPPGALSSGGSYLRLPWWLPYTLERGKCAFPDVMKREASPDEWLARRRFATILSSHEAYPRRLLFEALRGVGPVDSPNSRGPFKNMDWPAHLPNSHLTGKLDFLRDYRWQITPENQKCDGYITEKLGQAHISGVVPIYWGKSDAAQTVACCAYPSLVSMPTQGTLSSPASLIHGAPSTLIRPTAGRLLLFSACWKRCISWRPTRVPGGFFLPSRHSSPPQMPGSAPGATMQPPCYATRCTARATACSRMLEPVESEDRDDMMICQQAALTTCEVLSQLRQLTSSPHSQLAPLLALTSAQARTLAASSPVRYL